MGSGHHHAERTGNQPALWESDLINSRQSIEPGIQREELRLHGLSSKLLRVWVGAELAALDLMVPDTPWAPAGITASRSHQAILPFFLPKREETAIRRGATAGTQRSLPVCSEPAYASAAEVHGRRIPLTTDGEDGNLQPRAPSQRWRAPPAPV